MKRNSRILGITALCVSAWISTEALAQQPVASDAIPVNTVTATEVTLPKVIAGIGTVSPLQSVTVRPQVGGQVMSIAFGEGKVVQAGDLLLQIDPRELQASLTGAQARREQDAAQLATARSDQDRYTVLADKDVVSKQTLDQKRASVKQLEAAVAADEAAILNASNQLAFATVKASISGQTGFKSIDVGSLVAAGTTGVVTITQLDPIAVVFVAPGDRFDEIRRALKEDIAEVEAWSTDGRRLLAKGKLTLMDNVVDATNGSIRLRATFDNGTGALWPGLPVATRLVVEERRGISVPDKALSRGMDGLFAYVLQPGDTVKQVAVKTVFVTDGHAAIETGLKAGDRVVTDGTSRIVDGSRVQPTDRSNDARVATTGETR